MQPPSVHLYAGGVNTESRQNKTGGKRLVDRRRPQHTAQLAAVNHRKINGKRTAEHSGCLFGAPLRHCCANARRADRAALPLHRRQHDDLCTAFLSQLLQQRRIALSTKAEPVIISAANLFCPQPRTKHVANKILRPDIPHLIEIHTPQQRKPHLLQQLLPQPGTHQLRHRRQKASASAFKRLAEHRPVTDVQPVKASQRNRHRRRRLAERRKYLHIGSPFFRHLYGLHRSPRPQRLQL